jgi:hypothetical protein
MVDQETLTSAERERERKKDMNEREGSEKKKFAKDFVGVLKRVFKVRSKKINNKQKQ